MKIVFFFRKKSFFMISNYQKWLICIKNTNINDMSHNILYFEYFRPKGPSQNCQNGNFFEKNHFSRFLTSKMANLHKITIKMICHTIYFTSNILGPKDPFRIVKMVFFRKNHFYPFFKPNR